MFVGSTPTVPTNKPYYCNDIRFASTIDGVILSEAIKRACAKTFGPAPGNLEKRRRIVRLYFRGYGIRLIARKLRTSDVASVYRVLKKAGILRSKSDGCRTFWKMVALPASRILVRGGKHSRATVKKFLLRSGLLKNMCALCGLLPEWEGRPLVMVLDHKNGIRSDCRLKNMRLICPNCDSQTDTFKGRNKCSNRKKRGLRSGVPRALDRVS